MGFCPLSFHSHGMVILLNSQIYSAVVDTILPLQVTAIICGDSMSCSVGSCKTYATLMASVHTSLALNNLFDTFLRYLIGFYQS